MSKLLQFVNVLPNETSVNILGMMITQQKNHSLSAIRTPETQERVNFYVALWTTFCTYKGLAVVEKSEKHKEVATAILTEIFKNPQSTLKHGFGLEHWPLFTRFRKNNNSNKLRLSDPLIQSGL